MSAQAVLVEIFKDDNIANKELPTELTEPFIRLMQYIDKRGGFPNAVSKSGVGASVTYEDYHPSGFPNSVVAPFYRWRGFTRRLLPIAETPIPITPTPSHSLSEYGFWYAQDLTGGVKPDFEHRQLLGNYTVAESDITEPYLFFGGDRAPQSIILSGFSYDFATEFIAVKPTVWRLNRKLIDGRQRMIIING